MSFGAIPPALEALLGNKGDLLRAIIDAVPDPIFCKDLEGRFLLVNRANYESFGLTEADFLGRTVADLPGLREHAAEYEAQDRAVLSSGQPVISHEEPFVGRGGVPGWYLTSKFPLRDAQGAIIGLVGIARDITKRKAAERHLADERRRLQTLLDAIPDPLFIKDTARRNVLHNRASRQFFNRPDEEYLGKTVMEIGIPGDLAEGYTRDDCAVLAGRPIFNREEQFARADGTRGWFLTTKLPLRNEAGEITGLLGIARDITELKRDRAELERARQRLVDHMENTPLAVIEWDSEFRVSRWVGQAESVFGWTAEEVLGKRFDEWSFVHPDDEAWVAQVGRRLAEGNEQRNVSHNRNLTKAGEVVHCIWQNSVLRDADGHWVSMLSLVQDVTERVLAEEAAKAAEAERHAMERKLQETQRLESLGVLAGGIAHDFNNLLTGILGNASLAREDVGAESPVQPFLEQIESAALRAADLCRQMLAYSGKGRFEVRAINLNTVIEETTKLLRLSMNKSAELRLHLAPGLPAVLADASQLQQVVMNLVINASEAIGEGGGNVTVRTSVLNVDRAMLAKMYLAPELSQGAYVLLEVADEGCGMSPEVQARIFDPFFTTKFTGRGLGLAAVLGIVRGHNGAMQVESAPGQGSTFRVLLPCSESPVPSRAPTDAASARWKGAGTMLVVDDEEAVRGTASRLLESLGFTTLLAADGADGLAMFSTHRAQIVAVLLDLTMPRLPGDVVLREIRALDARIPVLLMSGYDERDVAERLAGQGVAGILQKPFAIETLRTRLQQLLS